MLANARSWCVCLAALMLALVSSLEAGATERKGAGAIDPKDPAFVPLKALVGVPDRQQPVPPMKLRQKTAADPAKIEHFIDGGLDRAMQGPTDRERAKLAAARVAVGSSRAAGALFGAVPRTPRLMAPLYEVVAGKHERLRTARPAPVTSSPELMGLPAGPHQRQKQGPTALSPRERAKLEARPSSSVTPEPGKEASR